MKKTTSRRTDELIAEFVNGFAQGWFMAVKECFKRELDIKYTQIVKNKKTHYELTQGIYYCFSDGQIIYDNINAYTVWDNAINLTNYACQIIESKPDLPPNQEDPDEARNNKINGYVKFVIYKKNTKHSKLEAFACYKASQTEFVKFLKDGVIYNENYKVCSFIK